MFEDRDLLLPLCQQGPFDYIQPRLYRFHMVGAQDVAPLERPAFAAYYGTLVVCFIMMVDLCLILAHLLDDRIWSKAYMHYSNNVISRPMNADELLKENKDMVIDRDIDPQTGKPKLTMTVNKAALDLRMKRINPSTVPKKQKQINYKKTYFEIDFNVHLMDYTAANMDLSENSVHALLPKLLFFFNWVRVPSM
jgi:hypothetical protein